MLQRSVASLCASATKRPSCPLATFLSSADKVDNASHKRARDADSHDDVLHGTSCRAAVASVRWGEREAREGSLLATCLAASDQQGGCGGLICAATEAQRRGCFSRRWTPPSVHFAGDRSSKRAHGDELGGKAEDSHPRRRPRRPLHGHSPRHARVEGREARGEVACSSSSRAPREGADLASAARRSS